MCNMHFVSSTANFSRGMSHKFIKKRSVTLTASPECMMRPHQYIYIRFNIADPDQTLRSQSELPRPISRYSVESDHGWTSRSYFENAGDNVTLTL